MRDYAGYNFDFGFWILITFFQILFRATRETKA